MLLIPHFLGRQRFCFFSDTLETDDAKLFVVPSNIGPKRKKLHSFMDPKRVEKIRTALVACTRRVLIVDLAAAVQCDGLLDARN